jgi:hypothetical protein
MGAQPGVTAQRDGLAVFGRPWVARPSAFACVRRLKEGGRHPDSPRRLARVAS